MASRQEGSLLQAFRHHSKHEDSGIIVLSNDEIVGHLVLVMVKNPLNPGISAVFICLTASLYFGVSFSFIGIFVYVHPVVSKNRKCFILKVIFFYFRFQSLKN